MIDTMALDKEANRQSGFNHPPIDPHNSIRLLRVQPNGPSPATYTFEIVPLQHLRNTSYKALSYTWGSATSPSDIHTITIASQPFAIRTNLFNFLTTFSQQLRPSDEPQLLFIDALCIDQLSPSERTAQIPHMSRIYRHASTVIAWLGLPAPNLSLGSLNPHTPPTAWSPAAIAAFHHLSHSPYWSRVWIVQEILLASRMTVHCGTYTFPLALFSGSEIKGDGFRRGRCQSPAERVVAHRLRVALKPEPDKLGEMAGGMEEMVAALRRPVNRSVAYQSHVPDGLMDVMGKFGGLGCVDARDKLYGFLGILNERTRRMVRADYGRGVGFAFEQAYRVGLLDGTEDGAMRWDRTCAEELRAVFGLGKEETEPIEERVKKELEWERWLEEVRFERMWAGQYGLGGRVVSLKEWQRLKGEEREDILREKEKWLSPQKRPGRLLREKTALVLRRKKGI
ncbi:hypothetical protein OQA88_5529 [Cercophora sp. LCS_1]